VARTRGPTVERADERARDSGAREKGSSCAPPAFHPFLSPKDSISAFLARDRERALASALATRNPRYAQRAAMADTAKIAKNLERFAQAVAAHDRENPTHTAHGIGLAHFDLERLGFEEGEEILPGITIHADGGVSGNFRVLCDGEHDDEDVETEAEEEIVDAVSAHRLPMIIPGAPPFPFEQ
jgi:hypothetical protein